MTTLFARLLDWIVTLRRPFVLDDGAYVFTGISIDGLRYKMAFYQDGEIIDVWRGIQPHD